MNAQQQVLSNKVLSNKVLKLCRQKAKESEILFQNEKQTEEKNFHE